MKRDTTWDRDLFRQYLSRELRNRGLSQADFSELSGIPRSTLNGWLRPKQADIVRAPGISSIKKISEALNVPADLVIAGGTPGHRELSTLQKECVALIAEIPDEFLAGLKVQLIALAGQSVKNQMFLEERSRSSGER